MHSGDQLKSSINAAFESGIAHVIKPYGPKSVQSNTHQRSSPIVSVARSCSVAALFLLLSLLVCVSHAADLSRDLREGRSQALNHGGYIEIGAGIALGSLPVEGAGDTTISIHIGGHYDWNRFFVDVLAESFSGFQAGYNIYSNELISFDFLTAVTEVTIDSDLSPELESLRDREHGLNAGFRGTFYQDNNLFQFELLTDVSSHHGGHVVSFFGGKNWLIDNWNLHTILGARYWSAPTLNYLVGVTEAESSDQFMPYQAGSGTSVVAEIGVTYPIDENWVFRGTLSQWMLSDSIESSPFITHDRYTSLVANVYFVY